MIPLIPVHRSFNGFFSEVHVGLPIKGYSRMIENMLDHENIRVRLGVELDLSIFSDGIYIIWTARPDTLLEAGYSLSFRAVRQEFQPLCEWNYKNAAVINYPSRDVPYLRKTNYSLLGCASPPVIGYEFSQETGCEAYPIRTHDEVRKWVSLKGQLGVFFPNVILHGRLAEFKYSSMDQSISDSFKKAGEIEEMVR
jgi:UDP-galactopyranose mutase